MTPPKLKNGVSGMKGFLRIGLFSGCMYFLFSIWTMWYLAFDGNGLHGFLVGIANVTIVHLLFLFCFSLSLYGLLPLRYILITGSLLSCNGCYWPVVRQAALDSNTIALQSYLYWLPLLYLGIGLLIANAGRLKGQVCKALLRYRYFTAGAAWMLLSIFLPKNNWFMPILYCNYFLILSLCYFQWKRDFRESYMRLRAAFLDHSGAAFIGIGLKLKAYSKLS